MSTSDEFINWVKNQKSERIVVKHYDPDQFHGSPPRHITFWFHGGGDRIGFMVDRYYLLNCCADWRQEIAQVIRLMRLQNRIQRGEGELLA